MNTTTIQTVLDTVSINQSAKGSINYAKCREAIEANLPNREQKRRAKMIVIDFLKGVKKPGLRTQTRERLPDFVEFVDTDGSKSRARF